MVWLSRRCFERLLVPFLPLSSENHFAQPMHYSQQIENINVKEFACVRACVQTQFRIVFFALLLKKVGLSRQVVQLLLLLN